MNHIFHFWHLPWCGGGGIALSSSVETTCISKQYQVSGQSGAGVLARDWDGEHDGAFPDASESSGPFWPPVGVRVWPSIQIWVQAKIVSIA